MTSGKGQFCVFVSLNGCVRDNVIPKAIAKDIADQLTVLWDVSQRYFLRIVAMNAQNALIRSSAWCNLGNVEEALQGQFFQLYQDPSAKDEYNDVELELIWLSVSVIYPKLCSNALKMLLQFSTIYLYEAGFSLLANIKTKFCHRLNVKTDLRCALV